MKLDGKSRLRTVIPLLHLVASLLLSGCFDEMIGSSNRDERQSGGTLDWRDNDA